MQNILYTTKKKKKKKEWYYDLVNVFLMEIILTTLHDDRWRMTRVLFKLVRQLDSFPHMYIEIFQLYQVMVKQSSSDVVK